MSLILTHFVNNLHRPLPELLVYLYAKIVSLLWTRSIGLVWGGFHLGGGTLTQNRDHIHSSDNFTSRKSPWRRRCDATEIGTIPLALKSTSVTCRQSVGIAAAAVRFSICAGVLFGCRVHRQAEALGRDAVIMRLIWMNMPIEILLKPPIQ